MVNEKIESLKSLGSRITPIRTKMIQLLVDSKKPVSVSEILKLVKANKTTIYRELEFLMAQGLVNEIDFGDGKKRYESSHLDHHHHLVCTKCGEIDDVDLEDVELDTKAAMKSGYQIQKHSLEFFGMCPRCQ